MRAETASTIDPAEVARFRSIAAQWWDPRGKFRPLHKLNPVRLAYIRDALCAHFGRDAHAPQPLAGLRVLDVGCGGGLLSEPLARMGAEVVGIDAEAESVGVAAAHARDSGTVVDYRATTVEALAEGGERFDAVLAMEVVEHVADADLFIEAISRVLDPGGLLFFATINRTPKSFAFAIVGAEWILRWLPRGTHDWRKLVRPSELAAGLRRHGLQVRDLTGVAYDPFADAFRLAPGDLDVNYMGRAVPNG